MSGRRATSGDAILAQHYQDLKAMVAERFNPADSDLITVYDVIESAADFIEAQPCRCEPEQAREFGEVCLRCSVLGRSVNKAVLR